MTVCEICYGEIRHARKAGRQPKFCSKRCRNLAKRRGAVTEVVCLSCNYPVDISYPRGE